MARLPIRRREDPDTLAAKICLQLGKKTKEYDADTLKACKAVLEDVARGKDDAFNAAISLHNIFKIPPYMAYKITRKIEEKSR